MMMSADEGRAPSATPELPTSTAPVPEAAAEPEPRTPPPSTSPGLHADAALGSVSIALEHPTASPSSPSPSSSPSALLRHTLSSSVSVSPHELSFGTLAAISCIAAGVQFGWAIQLSLLTPYLQTLGIPHAWASFVWLCGPISGLVVQPVVGVWSDRCSHPLGRRRPFLIFGAFFITAAVLLVGFSADLGYAAGDSVETGGTRYFACVVFVLGFWGLDLGNNTVQGPSRALLADLAGPQQRNAANAWYSLWVAIGSVLGYSAGANGDWYRWFPFLLGPACAQPCANLKAAFLIHICMLGVSTAVTCVAAKEEPWTEARRRQGPSIELQSRHKEEQPQQQQRQGQQQQQQQQQQGQEQEREQTHSQQGREQREAGEGSVEQGEKSNGKGVQGNGPERRESGEVVEEREKAREGGEQGQRQQEGQQERRDGGEQEQGQQGEQRQSRSSLSSISSSGSPGQAPSMWARVQGLRRAALKRVMYWSAREGEVLPLRHDSTGSSSDERSDAAGAAGEGGGRWMEQLREDGDAVLAQDNALQQGQSGQSGQNGQQGAPSGMLRELVLGIRDLPSSMHTVLLVTALAWMAWFPFLLFDTDFMGREVYHGDPNSATAAISQLYQSGVREGALGLLLFSVVQGFTSAALDWLCFRLGAARVWGLANLVTAACMLATCLLSLLLYLASPSHDAAPSSFITLLALLIFACLGGPFAVTLVVPFSLTASVSAQSGSGQGLSMGILNFAIVIPQIVVALLAGPLDALFGGGNVPAFAAAVVFAVLASVTAFRQLCDVPGGQPGGHTPLASLSIPSH